MNGLTIDLTTYQGSDDQEWMFFGMDEDMQTSPCIFCGHTFNLDDDHFWQGFMTGECICETCEEDKGKVVFVNDPDI